jgi:glycosyltransferase involved in cell wall biosynthesis
MFANKYLDKNQFTGSITELPHSRSGIAIVVPCYREPDVLKTLQSVLSCRLPQKFVEVIVLINHSEAAPEEIKAQNHHTRQELEAWVKIHSQEQLKYFVIGPVELKKKWAGAGTARKAGMDEAVERFNRLNKPDGIIVSLDADTLVDENYLIEIEEYFTNNPSDAGGTIHFSHQKEGLGERHLHGILLYEKYMNYYKRAMGFTGYPYPMFTVGSAFAVTAGAYVKRGGMNRRQAGEDFYFLQNLVQVGRVGEITSTSVHPSARLSARVPFGTGTVLQKWMEGEEDLRYTYRFDAYANLKCLFDKIDVLYLISRDDYETELSDLPKPVKAFLVADGFWNELNDLNRNCASLASFRLRFYYKFNAFKILKYLNYTHAHYFEKAELDEQFLLLKAAELNSV